MTSSYQVLYQAHLKVSSVKTVSKHILGTVKELVKYSTDILHTVNINLRKLRDPFNFYFFLSKLDLRPLRNTFITVYKCSLLIKREFYYLIFAFCVHNATHSNNLILSSFHSYQWLANQSHCCHCCWSVSELSHLTWAMTRVKNQQAQATILQLFYTHNSTAVTY